MANDSEMAHRRKDTSIERFGDHRYLEFPIKSVKKTKDGKIEWSMNKKYGLKELYQYRKDYPETEIVETLKDLQEAMEENQISSSNVVPKKSKIENLGDGNIGADNADREWYVRNEDFLVEGAKGAVFDILPKKAKKIKKTKKKTKNTNTSSTQ